MTTALSPTFRTLCRRLSGDRAARPVVLVDGDQAPVLAGEGWHYETRGGQYIRHPSAYSICGWSNMVYCRSTLRTEVGRDWIARRATTVATLGITPEVADAAA